MNAYPDITIAIGCMYGMLLWLIGLTACLIYEEYKKQKAIKENRRDKFE